MMGSLAERAVFFLLLVSAAAFAIGTPLNISNSPGDSLNPRIYVDSSGVAHAVWQECGVPVPRPTPTPTPTPILSCPFTIDSPGNYALSGNLGPYTGTCITILTAGSDSTLDCQSHSITGTGAANSYGIYLDGARRVTVKGCTVKGFNSGIFLDTFASYNNITGNNATQSAWGMYLRISDYNTVKNNAVSSNGHGIYLSESDNNSVIGNNVTSNNNGIDLDTSSNNRLEGNNASLNDNNGFHIVYSPNNELEGNRVCSNRNADFNCDVRSTGNTGGNIFDRNSGCGVTKTADCSAASVLSCPFTIDSPGYYTLSSDLGPYAGTCITVNAGGGGSTVDCKGHRITGNGNGDGILLEGSGITVTNCTVRNFDTGISSVGNDNLITGNVANLNRFGIGVGAIFGNNITGNNASLNDGAGIGLEGGGSHNITGNNASGNPYGIWLVGSSGNSLSGNNLTSNSIHGIFLDSASSNELNGNRACNNARADINCTGTSSTGNSGGNIFDTKDPACGTGITQTSACAAAGPPGWLYGTVKNSTGSPLSGATVRAESAGGSWTNDTTAGGKYVIYDLPPGAYVVKASLLNYMPNTTTAFVASGAGTEVNFTLELASMPTVTCPPSITECCIISSPGSYTLANNIPAPGTCIYIPYTGSRATLDCNWKKMTGSAGGNGVLAEHASGVTVRNCILENFDIGIVLLSTSNNNHILANTATGCRAGMGLALANGNEIRGNTFSNNALAGIGIVGSSGNVLADNTACGNGDDDIYCDEDQIDGGGNICDPIGDDMACDNSTRCNAGCASFHVSLSDGSSWNEKGVLHYGMDYLAQTVGLGKVGGEVRARIAQRGPEAYVDYVALEVNGGRIAPDEAYFEDDGESVLRKVRAADNDVVEATNRSMVAVWRGVPAGEAGLVLNAQEEQVRACVAREERRLAPPGVIPLGVVPMLPAPPPVNRCPAGKNWEIFYSNNSGGGWNTPVDISNTPADSMQPRIVMDSQGKIFVAWREWVPAQARYDLWYATSANRGQNWNAAAQLFAGGIASQYYELAVDRNDVVGIAFIDGNGLASYIPYSNGIIGGVMALDNVNGGDQPRLAPAKNGGFHVVWDRQMEIWYRNTNGGGLVDVSNTIGGSEKPDVAADSSDAAHVVWRAGITGDQEIWYAGVRGGVAGSAKDISDTPGTDSDWPRTATDPEDKLHVVWMDTSAGKYDIFYANSPDGGAAFSSPVNIAGNAGVSFFPAIRADSNGKPHVMWGDESPGNNEIYWNGWNGAWAGAQDVSGSSSNSYGHDFMLDRSNGVHGVFEDNAPGNYDIYYVYYGGFGPAVQNCITPCQANQSQRPYPDCSCFTPTAFCTDGTAYGACSATKPKYCESGSLVDRCNTCSCPSGMNCNSTSGACYLLPMPTPIPTPTPGVSPTAPPKPCASDDDCAGHERCEEGLCLTVSGVCGYAINHRWREYECCVPGDCAANMTCRRDHLCVPVNCMCGEIVAGVCRPYECCFDDECGRNESCVGNRCRALAQNILVMMPLDPRMPKLLIDAPAEVDEGERFNVTAIDERGNPVPGVVVGIFNKTFETDAGGNAEILAETPGEHRMAVSKSGYGDMERSLYVRAAVRNWMQQLLQFWWLAPLLVCGIGLAAVVILVWTFVMRPKREEG